MGEPAAISGDFATYRHVQGRKVLQLVIEVPAELAATVFAALGTPGAGEGIPVALARLHSPAEAIAKPEAPKERRAFSSLPNSQRAGMRCGEFHFQDFLQEFFKIPSEEMALGGADLAAQWVRHYCGVESRAEMEDGTEGGKKWEALEAEYYAWQRGRR